MATGKPLAVGVLLLACVAYCHAAISFPGVPFPFTDKQKHSVLATHHAVVGKGTALKPNAAAVANKMVGGFQLLFRSGEPGMIGAIRDVNGDPVYSYGPNYTKSNKTDSSVNPDSITVIPRPGDVNKADMFIHFESPIPASLYHVELSIGSDGHLDVVSYDPVDFTAWGGLWTPCAGSLTPWGTHLGSEEYEPDARAFIMSNSVNSRVRDFARYWGLYQGDFADGAAFMAEVRKVMNPYSYGYVTEVSYDAASGTTSARKWYSLGRSAVEMGLVMPDQKTVYITDDGRQVGFYKFVADRAGNLSTGTLYAARFNQSSDANGGVFAISWVSLGRTDHAILASELPKTNFSSIFDYMAPSNGTCPAGYTAVKHSYGEECLALKEGMEMHAAGFETRRYAAMLGATTEWSKWEGITFDSKRRRLYTAMSELDQGCLPEPSRFGGLDHVRLPANKCGCVYALDVDASYSATNMYALTCGLPDVGFMKGTISNNTCSIDGIANPDNVAYSRELDMLLIAEDADYHENNFLWSYDIPTGDMTRLISTPYGAEVTGTVFVTLNGATYIFNAMQHPYGDNSWLPLVNATEFSGYGGYVGYFGPVMVGRGQTLAMQHIPPPTTAAAKHSMVSSAKVVVGERVAATYDILERSSQILGNGTVGQQYDQHMDPIKSYTTPNWQVVENASVSNNPDFAALNQVCNTTFLSAHFEWQNPAAMYVTQLSRSPNGSFDAVSTRPVDWSAWGGLWTPCAGSISPWGTRMGSEEYEPDARLVEFATSIEQIGGGATASAFTYEGGNALAMARQFGLYYGNMTLEQFRAAFKPYMYGFITETKIQLDGSTIPQKHYLLGRVAIELAYVMPDRRTVYTTDDGTNVGFYKFVADRPGDLSSGSLYAGKFTQVDGNGGGKFRLDWVWLGWSTQEALMAATATTKFSDLFEVATPGANNGTNSTGPCPAGFKAINAGGRGCECLRVKAGMETYAAFLETRRYAAVLGATTEFSKWEGITYDSKRRKLYTSMSDVRYGMEDYKSRGRDSDSYDMCTSNDVRLQYNRCGCVYALSLDGGYSSYWMQELVCGTPTTDPSDLAYVPGNNCHPDRIASPDNVAYIPEHDMLMIGEDTSEHQNDVIWAYDMETAALTRILTTPYGAETTSPYWYPNIGGYAYLTASVQHPYGESDNEKADDEYAFGLEGAVGYVGPFPATVPAAVPETCTRSSTWLVTVQVEYDRSAASEAELARLDAYLLARVDALLAIASGADQASRVASSSLPAADGAMAVVANVQLAEKRDATALYNMLMDSTGSFQSDLSATFARLSASSGTYAIHGYEVKATAPMRVMQPRAYTPPRATL